MLDNKIMIIGIGADYPSFMHYLQSALSLGIPPSSQDSAYVLSTQYKSIIDLNIGWLMIRSLLGRGISCIEEVDDRKWLFSLYSHMNCQKVCDCCFDYTYGSSAIQVVKTYE